MEEHSTATLFRTDLLLFRATDPISCAVEALASTSGANKQTAVLITDARLFLLGIVTERDILTQVACKRITVDSPLETIMTRNPLFVKPSCTMMNALRVMHRRKFRHLPVCTADGRVVGIFDFERLGRIKVQQEVRYTVYAAYCLTP